ncbi:hypothetical protein CONPUDRAFT_82033 [Coniophora puteana RWD-64-598 SS2]|uniref:PDZ GRASP-type domain-containing protein n=1 Tax=Coniophora puteana (strain RWD-64-598) TaxID=741705 RepID=A0A5M3MQK0_CONPW|nr:uncharacterized protein CONPUDRAFT_82033 [Coniophora puteana RWD-64-598 SS2]EIW80915.1 hypothetical protein CONPUDRAFT_82033 [Coniophora puteana RWD-64-598 SS2]
MGAGQSSTSQQSPSHALHVLRVTAHSPASRTNIEPFFDFIVGFSEGDSLPDHTELDASELEKIVEEHEERTITLLVWSSKTKITREVPITPSRTWSVGRQQSGAEPTSKPSLLGLSMRMCEYESATDNVWHVMEVLEGSPAESAGLVPYGDWIIGWSGDVLKGENDFYDVVEAHVDKPLRVFVYSYDFDNLREVVLMPNRHWGGEGLLGCVFGYGLLHRIPDQPSRRNSQHQPASARGSYESGREFFVPADVSQGSVHNGTAHASHHDTDSTSFASPVPHRLSGPSSLGTGSQPGTPRQSGSTLTPGRAYSPSLGTLNGEASPKP